MSEVILKSFPFDSMDVFNETSEKIEADREYGAKVFQEYFKKFLSNGVYYGSYKNYGENGLKVLADGGLNIKVLKGAGIIEGVDFELDSDTIFTLERPAINEIIYKVVVRMDSTLSVRATKLYIKQEELQKNENIYEICIAEITVKSSTNISQENILDTRLDKLKCGIVSSLITIDGEEIYQQFKNYVNSSIENLVKKDEENILAKKLIVNGGIEGNVKGNLEGNAKTCDNARKFTKIK